MSNTNTENIKNKCEEIIQTAESLVDSQLMLIQLGSYQARGKTELGIKVAHTKYIRDQFKKLVTDYPDQEKIIVPYLFRALDSIIDKRIDRSCTIM